MIFKSIRSMAINTYALGLLITISLTGCGGGGGGGSTPSVTASSTSSSISSATALSISPSVVKLEVAQGRSASFTLTLTINPQIVTGKAFIGIGDPSNAITNQSEVQSSTATTAVIVFHTSSNLSVGVHTGVLNFYVCADDSCTSRYSSTPAPVQYEITVDMPPPVATVSPSSISASIIAGTAVNQVVLDVHTVDDLSVQSYYLFGISDSGQIFSPNFGAPTLDANHYSIVLSIVPVQAAGTYTGTLTLFVCNTLPCDQSAQLPGSPISIPYSVKVIAATPAAVITPGSISLSVEQNDGVDIVLNAAVLSGISANYFSAQDSKGIFDKFVRTSLIDQQNFSLTLDVSPIQNTGVYTGTLNINICGSYIDSYYCNDTIPLPGSPIAVPYTIDVHSTVLLQDDRTASGLPEWGTYQGTASHTGYIPVTLNPLAFSPKWNLTLPGAGTSVSPVTAGGGQIAVATSSTFSTGWLFVLNEVDGSIAWQHKFDAVYKVEDPAVYGGRVFVSTISSGEQPYMWSFDMSDGSQIFQTLFNSQWANYFAPTIRNGYVYANGGGYGGLYAFKARTGGRTWFSQLQWYNSWTPAVDDNYAYVYSGGEFDAVKLADGTIAFSVPNGTFNSLGEDLFVAPVLPGDGTAIVVDGLYGASHPGHLIGYDLANRREGWRVNGSFVTNPVVASGKIYLSNFAGNQLEARDEKDGHLLWNWSPSGNNELLFNYNLVLTDNLVFLCSSTTTYAIDLTTHQVAWSVPHVGNLAISSNKVLYISSDSDQTVYAYSLN